MRFVRWLGAFGRAPSLHEALQWELEGKRIVACEPLLPSEGGRSILWSKVGLEVAPSAVRRVFHGDVWSIRVGKTLVGTRRPEDAPHKWGEAFARPVYTAIVLRGRVSKQVFATVKWFSRSRQLPIRRMSAEGEWR